ncbi:MAG: hypothetical protein FRX48_07014 [Lasallia pustulata]|uniref:Uncharacterized protein n=1 Tax=Lasallia pustulata TaxID=136370 RepID=A0A5M8PKA0_9LECA|nr:MAG: hypothetical protein FRX48_07014 [Lasallia pustulata]
MCAALISIHDKNERACKEGRLRFQDTPAGLEFTHVADGKAEFTCRIGTQNAWYTLRHARFLAVHERPPLPTKWYAEREYAGGGTLDAGWAVVGIWVEWFA